MKPATASQTSAVVVKDGAFEEPMEYPQGANLYVRRLQAHPRSGIQNPGVRHPYYTAGSQKRLHGTGGGFCARPARPITLAQRKTWAKPREGKFILFGRGIKSLFRDAICVETL